MAEAPGGIGNHVFLDATAMGERFYERFPSITAACRTAGIDPARERIPVAPAAHYVCGGIAADLDGRTELAGLFAVGEVACTGVHGANRLASNSLTEGVVAGTRVGRNLSCRLPPAVDLPDDAHESVDAPLLNPAHRVELRSAMSSHVGVVRRSDGLRSVSRQLTALTEAMTTAVTGSRPAWEATNLLTVAGALVAAAVARTESRGCHRRTDWPDPRPQWLTHLDVRIGADGEYQVSGAPSGD